MHTDRCVIIQQRRKQGSELQPFWSFCFPPQGSEFQAAESGSARRMLRALLLIPSPEERKPPEQFIFRLLAVFQFFTSLCVNKFNARFFMPPVERMLGLLGVASSGLWCWYLTYCSAACAGLCIWKPQWNMSPWHSSKSQNTYFWIYFIFRSAAAKDAGLSCLCAMQQMRGGISGLTSPF